MLVKYMWLAILLLQLYLQGYYYHSLYRYNKVYLSFSQESDEAWDVEFETPNGQQSSLSASNFDKKENIYYSDIMNDSNSPGGIIEGDRIRDTSLLAKLSLVKNTLTRIFSVNFNAIPSYRSNK